MSVVLAKDETLVSEISIPTSLFSKSHYQLTTKRLIAKTNRTLLGIIPIGSTDNTYPLGNIASVGTVTQFKIGTMFLGILLCVMGLAGLAHGWGIIVLILGALAIVAAFPGAFVVTNNAGQTMSHAVWITGRQAAKEFVHQVNQAIVDRS